MHDHCWTAPLLLVEASLWDASFDDVHRLGQMLRHLLQLYCSAYTSESVSSRDCLVYPLHLCFLF